MARLAVAFTSLALFLAWPQGLASATFHPSVVSEWRFGWQTIAEGLGTYYGEYYDRGEHYTASGVRYNRSAGIVALPQGLYRQWQHYQVRVTNLETGIAYLLRVEDTGLMEGVYVADLPDGIWEILSGKPKSAGVFPVRVEVGMVR